jgi:glutamate--cysteine ligase
LSRDRLAEFFARAERPGSRLIGTEQEKFGIVLDGTKMPSPVDYHHHVRAVLEGLVERYGWRPSAHGTGGEVIALERDRASITLEPGGQLELSGAPLPSVHDTCAEFTQHYDELDAIGRDLGIAFLTCGFHPFARRDEINWMPKERYEHMRRYLPSRGSKALDMMLRTCTVQANFDFGSETECGDRLRMSMALSPLVTALFANSPFHEGERSSLHSLRSDVWTDVDPDRCGILPWVFDEPFSYERYIDWVLDVPMFFIYREGRLVAHHAPFRHFLAHGLEVAGHHEHATFADWELHLSTVFPEVRLKPFVEVRGADSVGSRWVCALPALLKGVMYDDEARSDAYALVADLDFGARVELWREARVQALRSPRIRDACEKLLAIARRALDRLDDRDKKGRTEARFLDPLDEIVRRGESPADVALAAVGDRAGRDRTGRLAFVEAFRFAGATLA